MAIPVFRQFVERAREIAGAEIGYKRKARHIHIVQMGRCHRRILVVHFPQEAADIIGDNIGLQCPRRVDIAEHAREIGDVVEHHTLIIEMLAKVDRCTVNADCGLAHRHKIEARGGDNDVGVEMFSRLQLDTCFGKLVDMLGNNLGLTG